MTARFTLLTGLLWLSATQVVAGPADWRIVPGRSIGHIRIGQDAEEAMRRLGTADTGEGAAGHSWATWFGNGTPRSELDLYTTLATGADGKIVRIVRVTSPAFRTMGGLHTGSTLASIRAAFPHLRRIAAYRPDPGGPVVRVWDDARRGIAFEVMQDDGICTAISVHRPGRNPMDETMRMTLYVRSIHSRLPVPAPQPQFAPL